MTELPNLKELEKLLKMCRKQGITDLTLPGMSFKFGDLPRESTGEEADANPSSISDEDMAYWSAAPDPLAALANQ